MCSGDNMAELTKTVNEVLDEYSLYEGWNFLVREVMGRVKGKYEPQEVKAELKRVSALYDEYES